MTHFKEKAEAFVKDRIDRSVLSFDANDVEIAYLAGVKAGLEAAAEVAKREANSFDADKSGDYRDGWYLAARWIWGDIRALGEE